MSATNTVAVSASGIPAELKQFPNWVMWRLESRNGDLTKPLYCVNSNGHPRRASHSDPKTWASFDAALEKYNTDAKGFFEGIGFVLTNSPFVGVDFDGVISDGKCEPYVLEILKHLGDPYSEVSPSGNGLHCFVKAPLPDGQNKFLTKSGKKYGAEIYKTNRYLCCTGERFSGNGIPTRENINLAYFLISQIRNEKFKSLWMGDMSGYANDQSRADLALLGILIRLLDNNGKLAEEYFGESKLGERSKWRDRADYRKLTLDKALKPQSQAAPQNEQPVTTAIEYDLRVDDAVDFIKEAIPKRPVLLSPFLTEKSIGMIHAWRGVGKTHFALGAGLAVATGGQFLKWKAPQAAPVMLVDGEMPQEQFQEWLKEATTCEGVPPLQKGFFRIISADRQDTGLPSLIDPRGQQFLDKYIEEFGPKLIIFDNITTLFRGCDEKEGADWEDAQEWLISLRRRGIATLLLHHDGKGFQQRGTSKREDPLDWVIQLRHPSDYRFEQGLRCEVEFKKARGIYGADTRPFEAQLSNHSGIPVWTLKENTEALADTIREMRDSQGMSFREIANKLKSDGRDISKSTAERLYNKPVATKDEMTAGF